MLMSLKGGGGVAEELSSFLSLMLFEPMARRGSVMIELIKGRVWVCEETVG